MLKIVDKDGGGNENLDPGDKLDAKLIGHIDKSADLLSRFTRMDAQKLRSYLNPSDDQIKHVFQKIPLGLADCSGYLYELDIPVLVMDCLIFDCPDAEATHISDQTVHREQIFNARLYFTILIDLLGFEAALARIKSELKQAFIYQYINASIDLPSKLKVSMTSEDRAYAREEEEAREKSEKKVIKETHRNVEKVTADDAGTDPRFKKRREEVEIERIVGATNAIESALSKDKAKLKATGENFDLDYFVDLIFEPETARRLAA